jgi:hypothetical protein
MPKGKRVQIYIPADLVEKWDALPRYERSAEVAAALRQRWGMEAPNVATNVATETATAANTAAQSLNTTSTFPV